MDMTEATETSLSSSLGFGSTISMGSSLDSMVGDEESEDESAESGNVGGGGRFDGPRRVVKRARLRSNAIIASSKIDTGFYFTQYNISNEYPLARKRQTYT